MRRLLVLAALVLALGLAAPSSSSAWSSPQTVAGSAGTNVFDPDVSIDPAGNSVIAFSRTGDGSSRIEARRRRASGALDARQVLSPPGMVTQEPQVVTDAGGNAIVLWRFNDGTWRVALRRRAADGTLSAVQVLTPGGSYFANFPCMDADSSGRAVVAWVSQSGIKARRRAANGQLGPTLTLAGAGTNPQLAMDDGGNALVVWQRSINGILRIQARRVGADDTLGPTLTLSSPTGSFDPQVDLDADGNGAVVWSRNVDGIARVQMRAITGSATVSPVQTLSPGGQNALEPQVASRGGHTIAAWKRDDGVNPGVRVQARYRNPSGTLSTYQTLSGRGIATDDPRVGIDAQGNARVAWQAENAGDLSDPRRIEVRERQALGTLGPVVRASPRKTSEGPFPAALDPQLGVNASGAAALVWYFLSDPFVVQVSADP